MFPCPPQAVLFMMLTWTDVRAAPAVAAATQAAANSSYNNGNGCAVRAASWAVCAGRLGWNGSGWLGLGQRGWGGWTARLLA